MGAEENLLVSMAGDGAILLTEEGVIYEAKPPKGKVLNSVGAGDALVAGFLTGYLNTGDYEKAFRLGVVTGSATAFQYWLATKEDIVALMEDKTRNLWIIGGRKMKIVDLLKKESLDLNGTVSDQKETIEKMVSLTGSRRKHHRCGAFIRKEFS